MRATAWHNGGVATEPAGYGVKLEVADRDRDFDPMWDRVTLELEDGPIIEVELSDSFWRNCSELRSADIGRWLMAAGAAPWPSGQPPGIAVRNIDGSRFSARVLKQHTLR